MKVIALCLTLSVLASFAPSAHGQSALRPLPPLLRSVSDEVGVLSVPQGKALSNKLFDAEKRTSAKIIVVIAATVAPESIEAYAQRLANHWRGHSQALDSGRFVFVVVAKHDRALRIVPGKKLTRVLKPFMDSGIMADARALLKQDKYFEALAAIVDKLSQLIGGARSVVLNGKSETTGFGPGSGLFVNTVAPEVAAEQLRAVVLD